MSCWVVPSLAAEFWGVSVDQVMQKINNGVVPTRQEHGFTVIDVAPDGPRAEPARKPVYPPAQPAKPIHESQLPAVVEEINDPLEHDAFGDWRAARAKASRTRKPPEARYLN